MDFLDFFLLTLLCAISFLFGVNLGRKKKKEWNLGLKKDEYKPVELNDLEEG